MYDLNQSAAGKSIIVTRGICDKTIETSEMDANTEEVSSGIAAGMPVPRKPGHLSSATESEAPAQTIAVDLRALRQVLLRRETPGRTLR